MRLRKGASYMHALCKCQSARSFCFHQHGFENHISLVWTHVIEHLIIHKAGMLRVATIDLQLVLRSSSHPEASREKVLLSENEFIIICT